jgi:nucleotide-binding universal stress UspA family protein
MTEVWLRAALWRGLALAARPISSRRRAVEDLDQSLRRQAQERNVTLETPVLVGHPADQILKSAARHGADMIVVRHQGRSAIRASVSGSTSRRVFTRPTCPVLSVRAS